MSDHIDISYTWDKDTYIQASKLAYDYELKKSSRRYLGWLFIALTQFGVVAAMKQGSIGLLLISTILVLYWYMFRWPLRKRFIEKTFDKLPNANTQYTISTSDTGITTNGEDITWSNIANVLVLKEGIFLYLASNSIFIPNKAFDAIEERSDFLKTLKQNVTNYTKET
jgi:hypothetical protein